MIKKQTPSSKYSLFINSKFSNFNIENKKRCFKTQNSSF